MSNLLNSVEEFIAEQEQEAKTSCPQEYAILQSAISFDAVVRAPRKARKKETSENDLNIALQELMGLEGDRQTQEEEESAREEAEEKARQEEERKRDEEENRRKTEEQAKKDADTKRIDESELTKIRAAKEAEAAARLEEQEKMFAHEDKLKQIEEENRGLFGEIGSFVGSFFARSSSGIGVGPGIDDLKLDPNGIEKLRLLSPLTAESFEELSRWEKNYGLSTYDNLMAAQCIQLDQLLCELLLTDGQDIAEELKPHMSPKQQEIIDYFHYKDSRPTLGLVQLWMVALRRALVDSKSPDELLLNWISHNFANAQSKNTMTTPIDLFTNKSLLAFIDRLRSKYRNPLVHASSEPSPKFNKSEYKVWCNDAYGSPTLSKWLHKGWTGDMGWISALVCSAKIN